MNEFQRITQSPTTLANAIFKEPIIKQICDQSYKIAKEQSLNDYEVLEKQVELFSEFLKSEIDEESEVERQFYKAYEIPAMGCGEDGDRCMYGNEHYLRCKSEGLECPAGKLHPPEITDKRLIKLMCLALQVKLDVMSEGKNNYSLMNNLIDKILPKNIIYMDPKDLKMFVLKSFTKEIRRRKNYLASITQKGGGVELYYRDRVLDLMQKVQQIMGVIK